MADKSIPSRKIVSQSMRCEISTSLMEGKVVDIVDMLTDLMDKYGNDITLKYGQHDMYDDAYSYLVYRNRPETDEEYIIRIGNEAQMAADQLDRDRAAYERLYKIFGDQKKVL